MCVQVLLTLKVLTSRLNFVIFFMNKIVFDGDTKFFIGVYITLCLFMLIER